MVVMKVFKILTFLYLFTIFACTKSKIPVIEVAYSDSFSSESFDGRLLVMITKDGSSEPRFQINDSKDTGILIGKNVENENS